MAEKETKAKVFYDEVMEDQPLQEPLNYKYILQTPTSLRDISKSDADRLESVVSEDDLGAMAFENLVEKAKLGDTLIEGGYIKTELLDVNDIFARNITATGTITGGTFIGSKIRTATSGKRIELGGSLVQAMDFYDDSYCQASLLTASGYFMIMGYQDDTNIDISTGRYGNITLGVGDTSSLAINEDYVRVSSDYLFSQCVVPSSTNTYNLGYSDYRWKGIYTNNIFLPEGGRLAVGSTGSTREYLEYQPQFYSSYSGVAIIGMADMIPFDSGIWDIGRSDKRFHQIYLANNPNVSSSRDIKKDIKDCDYGLKDIIKLRPRNYKLKESKDDKESIGLVVEEIEKVIPEVTEKGDSYRPSDLIPVLVNAIKELNTKVDNLAKQVKIK